MNLQENILRIKQMMGVIKEDSVFDYTSFSELTDQDLFDIAVWGLNKEYEYSSCETPECAVEDFKSFLNKPYPEELGDVPDEVIIYRLVRLKNENDLNKKNLGYSWFSNPNQIDKWCFYDMLDHLRKNKTDDGEVYLLEGQTKQSNIDIPRTLWERSTQWCENEIVVKNDNQIKLIGYKKL